MNNLSILKLVSLFECSMQKHANFFDKDVEKFAKFKILQLIEDILCGFTNNLGEMSDKLYSLYRYENTKLDDIFQNTRILLKKFDSIEDVELPHYDYIAHKTERFLEELKHTNKTGIKYITQHSGNADFIQITNNIQKLIEDTIDQLESKIYDFKHIDEFIINKFKEKYDQDWRPNETIPEDYYAL